VALKDKLASEGLMQANLLQLNVLFNANKYNIQKDVEAFSYDAFGAQLGGVFGLWLGVTIMPILEVFEFIINLVSACYKMKRHSVSPDSKLHATMTVTKINVSTCNNEDNENEPRSVVGQKCRNIFALFFFLFIFRL